MGTVVLAGATSGSTTLTPVDAVTATITLPSATGTLATTAGSSGTSLVLISTATASSSATIDFTSGLTSTYDEYLITLTNVIPATNNAVFYFRVSEDGGSTYKAGATDYKWVALYQYDWALTPSGDGSTGSTFIDFASTGISNTATNGGVSGEIRIFGPSSTVSNKQFSFAINGTTNTNSGCMQQLTQGRFVLDTNAINAVRIVCSSGNIASGTFALYGVRKS
jgi:hypothetical protein